MGVGVISKSPCCWGHNPLTVGKLSVQCMPPTGMSYFQHACCLLVLDCLMVDFPDPCGRRELMTRQLSLPQADRSAVVVRVQVDTSSANVRTLY